MNTGFPSDIREYKQAMRLKIKGERMKLPPDYKLSLDKRLLSNLLRLREYQSCHTLLTYVSTDIEVDTKMLINQALADGKRVAVPRCIVFTRGMEFHYINSLDDLSPGTFSVLEPEPFFPKVTSTENSLLIVPALCIDKRGYRLGYGKGYYDRYMSGFKGASAGVCYSANITERMFHGRFDRAVDIIVSERAIRTLKPRVTRAPLKGHEKNVY